MLKGIDISKYQDKTPSLAGLSFVAIRASIGAAKDELYDTHYANCRKAGPMVIAYHYGLDAADVSIAKQVSTFLAAGKDADLLALDQEQSGFSDGEAQAFVDGVRAAGRPCGLYHSSSGFGGVNADFKWVADWRDSSEAEGYPNTADGTKEVPGWAIWQYDGGGADGIDNDYLNPDVTLAELLRVGYVTKAAVDAAVAQKQAELAAATSTIEDLRAKLSIAENDLTAAQSSLLAREVELTAVAKERDDANAALLAFKARVAGAWAQLLAIMAEAGA